MMLPVPALYGVASLLGAGGLGGLLAGRHVLNLANDRADAERIQRQLQLLRPVIEEAVTTHAVERTARDLGIDVDALKAQVGGAADSRADVRSLLSVVGQYVGNAQE